MSLRETLAALDATLPGLGARVSAPHEIGRSLEHATQELLHRIQQKESAAAERLDGAQQALAGLRDEASGVETRLEEETGSLEDLARDHSQTFGEGRKELTREILEARQAMDALQERLDESGLTAQAEYDDVSRAVSQLEDGMDTAQRELQAAVDALMQDAEGLAVAAEDAHAGVEQDLNTLGETMTRLAEGARERLQRAAEELEEIQASHEDALHEQGSALTEARDGLVTALGAAIEKDLKARLGKAANEAAGALRSLAEEAHDAAERVATSRTDLVTTLDGFRSQESPIARVIEHAKVAVQVVGLVWGV